VQIVIVVDGHNLASKFNYVQPNKDTPRDSKGWFIQQSYSTYVCVSCKKEGALSDFGGAAECVEILNSRGI
jgi:hypothetical protein